MFNINAKLWANKTVSCQDSMQYITTDYKNVKLMFKDCKYDILSFSHML